MLRFIKWLWALLAVPVLVIAAIIATALGIQRVVKYCNTKCPDMVDDVVCEPLNLLLWVSAWREGTWARLCNLGSWFKADERHWGTAIGNVVTKPVTIPVKGSFALSVAILGLLLVIPKGILKAIGWVIGTIMASAVKVALKNKDIRKEICELQAEMFLGTLLYDWDETTLSSWRQMIDKIDARMESKVESTPEEDEFEEFLDETMIAEPPWEDTEECLAAVTLDEITAVPDPSPEYLFQQAAQTSEFRLAGMGLSWQEQLHLWSAIVPERNTSDTRATSVQEALTVEVGRWKGEDEEHREHLQGLLVSAKMRSEFLP